MNDRRLIEEFWPIKAVRAELLKERAFHTCLPPAKVGHVELRVVPGAWREIPTVAFKPAVPKVGKGEDV